MAGVDITAKEADKATEVTEASPEAKAPGGTEGGAGGTGGTAGTEGGTGETGEAGEAGKEMAEAEAGGAPEEKAPAPPPGHACSNHRVKLERGSAGLCLFSDMSVCVIMDIATLKAASRLHSEQIGFSKHSFGLGPAGCISFRVSLAGAVWLRTKPQCPGFLINCML